eukprot:366052-Chlamydomonas_euryale.AAC.4
MAADGVMKPSLSLKTLEGARCPISGVSPRGTAGGDMRPEMLYERMLCAAPKTTREPRLPVACPKRETRRNPRGPLFRRHSGRMCGPGMSSRLGTPSAHDTRQAIRMDGRAARAAPPRHLGVTRTRDTGGGCKGGDSSS